MAAADVFVGLRNQALHASRTTLGLPAPAGPTEPWGVLMETGYPSATATVVAFADGNASIYLSSPVRSAGAIQPRTSLTSTFLLPAPGQKP